MIIICAIGNKNTTKYFLEIMYKMTFTIICCLI